MLTREILELYKVIVMRNSSQNSGDQNIDRKVESKDKSNEISHRLEDSIGNWTKDHTYFILTDSLFFLCPETLCKAEFKGGRQFSVAKLISREINIQGVTLCCWFLLAIDTGKIRKESWTM